MARRPRRYFKASPWELEDAEEEQIEIVINHAPKRFVVENGKLNGMEFERLECGGRERAPDVAAVLDTVFIPADDVILAIGQENAFPWIERDLGIEFDKWDMPVVDEVTFQSTPARRLLRRRRGVRARRTSSGPSRTAHQAAISIHNHCQGVPVTERPPQGMNLMTQKMGLHEWSYSNDYNPAKRAEDDARRSGRALQEAQRRGRAGLHAEQTAREVERCLNCDIQTVFTDRSSASSATPASTSARCTV